MSSTQRSRFPKTSLKVAKLIHVDKTVGILRDAIEDDVEYLLHHFRSCKTHSFKDFDELWNSLHYSLVHFACVKRDFRENYMNAFHTCILDHFHSPSVMIKNGVIFMLYFLYMSQPTVWGKNRIRVSSDLWKLLFDYYTDSVLNGINCESAHVFNQLREMGAFMFVEQTILTEHSIPERREFEKCITMIDALQELKMKQITNEAVDLCINQELSELHNIATEYQSVKKDTFYTPQAFIATQRNLKESLNVTENRPRLLQNVLLNSTLAKDETETLKQVTRFSQQMWNSKRRKLQRNHQK